MDPSDEDAPPPQMIECRMCHQLVPANETTTFGGRVLCFGCAASWFEEDEDEPAD